MTTLLALQHDYDTIPGTTLFDGRLAMKGYALNKMCYSFNSAENREAYRQNPEAYCDLFGLTAEQRKGLQHRNVAELIEAGGNIYYLAKWAGIYGITVQQIGAQERGITEDAFKAMLLREGGSLIMAKIIGGIATSHIPAIGKAIAQGLHDQPYWKPFFDGYNPVHDWLREAKPDIVVIIYNDHGLNFFLDKIPTFAVGAAPEYRNSDEGWGLPVSLPFPGYPEMSWHIIESLVHDEFDITMCQEMLVDHAVVVPLTLMWPEHSARPVRIIPVAVNTVQFPLPTPARCFKLGAAISRAVESFEENLRVVVVGSGGLSHQLEGKRAGFINRKFDLSCLDRIVSNADDLSRMSVAELVRMAGVQGVELLNWLVMRGALTGSVSEKHRNYHVPISNTAAAVMVLENEAVPAV